MLQPNGLEKTLVIALPRHRWGICSCFILFFVSDFSSRSLNAFIWLNAYNTSSSQSFSLWPSLFLPLGHFGPCHCSTLTSRPAPVPRQRAVVLHMFAPGLCLLSCTSLCTAPLIRSACPVSFFPFALCSLSAARRPKALWRGLWRRRGRQMGRGPGGPPRTLPLASSVCVSFSGPDYSTLSGS